MTDAFVTVVVDGDAGEIASTLSEIDAVSAAHHVRGEYDVLVELTLEEPERLQEIVTGLILKTDGVEDTTTVVTPELAELHEPEPIRLTPAN
ncbi:Lrp/AsnC ligand binding domain-containing protein [Halovivax limisalsi]|uniref:Lrp/AsnC ligand binding domain-containing protein n=1 Tax=Halovivax limisalsi TaxID=1453760 RepID=UPI001FFCCC14|nr:Lrp/AsnC ligand binding domain-containing protein [Halovivax limisalsi]